MILRNFTGIKHGTEWQSRGRYCVISLSSFTGLYTSCAPHVGYSLKMNKVLCIRTAALKTSEAVSILENILEPESTTTLPPVKPKAGEVYLYRNNDKSKTGKHAI